MENNIKTVMDILADEIIENIRENIASYGVGDGNLAKSLEPDIEDNRLKIWANDYWDEAQVGRGPGEVPENFVQILEEWIDRRRIPYYGSKRIFAQNISRKTKFEGSYLYRHPEDRRNFLDGVLDESLSKFQEKFYIFIKDKLQ